jgi:hypothetical protein
MWGDHVQEPLNTYIGGWLAEPSFPDAKLEDNDSYLLDLGSAAIAAKGAVEIWVPAYSQLNIGDRVKFTFVPVTNHIGSGPVRSICRYLYLKDPVHELSGNHYKISLQPLQCLPPGRYEAFYMVSSRTNNVSLSKHVTVDVINTPLVPAAISQFTLCGLFPPGPVAYWVISNDYRLAKENVIFHSIGPKNSSTGVRLGLYRTSGGTTGPAFATLSTLDGKSWTYAGNETQLSRGDVVSVQLEGEGDAAIYLAAAM